jgi:hypothetical protein
VRRAVLLLAIVTSAACAFQRRDPGRCGAREPSSEQRGFRVACPRQRQEPAKLAVRLEPKEQVPSTKDGPEPSIVDASPGKARAVARAGWTDVPDGVSFELAWLDGDALASTIVYDLGEAGVDDAALCAAIRRRVGLDRWPGESTFLGIDLGTRHLLVRQDEAGRRAAEAVLDELAVVGPSVHVRVDLYDGSDRPSTALALDVPWRGRVRAFEGTSWGYVEDYDIEIGMGGARTGAPILGTVEACLVVTAEREVGSGDSGDIDLEIALPSAEPTLRTLSFLGLAEYVALEQADVPVVRWRGRVAPGSRSSVPVAGNAWAAITVSSGDSVTVSRTWCRLRASSQEFPVPAVARATLVRRRTHERWEAAAPLYGRPGRASLVMRSAEGTGPYLTAAASVHDFGVVRAAFRTRRISGFHVEDVALGDVVRLVGASSGVEVRLGAAVRPDEVRVTLGPLDDVSVRDLLDLVTAPFDLRWEIRGRGVEILRERDDPSEGSIVLEALWQDRPGGDESFDVSLSIQEPAHRSREFEAKSFRDYGRPEPVRLELPIRRVAGSHRRVAARDGRGVVTFEFDLGSGPELFDVTVERLSTASR